MEWGAEQAHGAADQEQRQPEIGTARKKPAGQSRQSAKHCGAKAHNHQRQARTESVDEPPTRNHANRIDQEKRRIDCPHPGRLDGKLLHNPVITRDRDADAIEVTDKAQRHEQSHDVPANRGGSSGLGDV